MTFYFTSYVHTYRTSIITSIISFCGKLGERWTLWKILGEKKGPKTWISFPTAKNMIQCIIKQNMHNHRIRWEEVQTTGRGNLNWPAGSNDCICSPSSEKPHYTPPRISTNFRSNKVCSNAKKDPTQTAYAHLPQMENLISSFNNNHQQFTLLSCDYSIIQIKIFTWSALNYIW